MGLQHTQGKHGCSWVAYFNKRASKGDKNRKAGGSWWYFNKEKSNVKHSLNCHSQRCPSAALLLELSAFRVAAKNATGDIGKLTSCVSEEFDKINFTGRKSLLYKAAALVRDNTHISSGDLIQKLPGFLLEFSKLNDNSVVALQLDEDSRFFRCFISCKTVLRTIDACFPVYCLDAGHCSGADYNGVYLILTGVDGEGYNIQLAMAYVHVENKENYLWFITLCIEAGVPLSSSALFVDRGHMVPLAKDLAEEVRTRKRDDKYLLNLKFCTMHIERNVRHTFNICGSNDDLHRHIFALQGSVSREEYEMNLNVFRGIHYLNIPMSLSGCTIFEYLESINPINWVVYANDITLIGNIESSFDSKPSLCDDNTYSLQHDVNSCASGNTVGNVYAGQPLPLFGIRTTNQAEGEMNKANKNCIRSNHPLYGVSTFVDETVKGMWTRREKIMRNQASIMDEEVTKLAGQGSNLNNQRAHDIRFQVFTSDGNVFCVRHPTWVRHDGLPISHEVDVARRTCSCSSFQQMRRPCVHVLAVQRSNKSSLCGKDLQYFHHPVYLADTYKSAFQQVQIRFPVGKIYPKCNVIRMCPRYNQKGPLRKKRLASNGESTLTQKRVYKPKRQRYKKKKDESTQPKFMIYEVPDTAHAATCTRCGRTGHYKTTCNYVVTCSGEHITRFIHGKDFLVGGSIFGSKSLYEEKLLARHTYCERTIPTKAGYKIVKLDMASKMQHESQVCTELDILPQNGGSSSFLAC